MRAVDERDIERVTRAMREIGEAFGRIIERTAKALKRITESLIPLFAAEGIAQIEMDLKLRAEVGLRTDLLALFDP